MAHFSQKYLVSKHLGNCATSTTTNTISHDSYTREQVLTYYEIKHTNKQSSAF